MEHSPILGQVSISVNDWSSIVSVFPNPVSNGEANVSISATSDGLAHWKLIDNVVALL